MSSCWTYKTEHDFAYDRNYTTLVGDIGVIYCGTLVDNQNYYPIRSLEKSTREQFRSIGK